MFRFEKFSKAIESLSTGVKVILIAGSCLAALSATYAAGKTVLTVPIKIDSTNAKLDKHVVDQAKQTEILNTMLCIQIADHRKSDWTACVVPH